MLKEIKYLIFILIIGIFLFFTGRYYFSDQNIKKSYRSHNDIEKKNQDSNSDRWKSNYRLRFFEKKNRL